MIHALLNHLWQSTLFTMAAGLLTLALRKNGAHTRYWLWFAASCKFLIPFSLLSALGSHLHLGWRSTPYTAMPPILGEFAQPFSPATVAVPVASAAPSPPSGIDPLMILMGVWACGALVMGIYWLARWLRIQAAVRSGKPLRLDAPIPVRSSPVSLEPGVVGLFRPVLMLPEGICERLTPAQMQTILTHEMCHVQQRDNLTAAIHMLVEALFWFHPLVWWMGRRLIVEREGACDEAVIAAGGDRETYAEGLVTVCKFYLESPLECAAGVAGADLKKRIEFIMTPRVTQKLNAARKVLLATAAAAAILTPIVSGSVFATTTRLHAWTEGSIGAAFQSVSIRESQPGDLNHVIHVSPDGFSTENSSLRNVIAWADDSQDVLISGPRTLEAKYNIDAKAPGAFPPIGYVGVDKARAMVRKMLADRLQLETHRATQSLSVMVLTANGGSTHMQEAPADEPGPQVFFGPTSIGGQALRMGDFAQVLARRLGHPVIDQTGLTKIYNFKLDWKTDASAAAGEAEKAPAAPSIAGPEVIINALQNQLGITARLEQRPVEVLVVDRVQPPKDLLPAHKAIPMDPHLFEAYVGHYEFPGKWLMTVSRENERFWTQLQGQPKVEVYPEGKGEFFATVVDAQISFVSDTQGRATELILHQGGRDTHAPRMDETKAKQIIDKINARIQQNVPIPGSEQALRRLIQETARGKPDYGQMSPELATATRQQLPQMQKGFAELGTLVLLKFTGVDPWGWDIYKAQFEHGSEEWGIDLAPDGKIDGAWVSKAQ